MRNRMAKQRNDPISPVMLKDTLHAKSAYQTNVRAWVCFMVIELTLGALALYVSFLFVIPFFILIVSGHLVFNKIVCPKCGTPVTYQGGIMGVRITGGFIRKKCQNCGWDLRKMP